MTTSTSTLDISNLTRHCSTLPPKTAPTKKIKIQTPAPPRLHQWRHSKYRVNFLVGRQLKQFVDIITMNAVHHTKYEHARVLDIHFIKAQQSDDSSDSDSDLTAASTKRQKV